MDGARENLDILSCKLDHSSLTVGEKLTLTCPLPIANAPGVKPHFIDANTGAPYEIRFLGEPSLSSGLATQAITSYKVGKLELGMLKLVIDGKEYPVSPQMLEVQSVLPTTTTPSTGAGTEQPTPFPIYDPLYVRAPWWWWAMWGILITCILGYFAYHFFKWKKERSRIVKESAEAQLQTPFEKFRQRLRKLESHGYHQRGEYKSFALELTQILKVALAEKLKFPAEDLTSEELASTLERRYKSFHKLAGPQVAEVLGELDQIKFAKVETIPENCLRLIDQTMKIGNALFEGTL